MNEPAQDRRVHKRKFRAAIFPAVLLAGFTAIAGCASTADRPDRALAEAQVGIQQAEQSGAAQFGAAELAAARNKLAAAQSAADRDEMATARRLAQQAALDAELANAMARNRKAQAAADEQRRTIEVLQEEIARNQAQMRDMR